MQTLIHANLVQTQKRKLLMPQSFVVLQYLLWSSSDIKAYILAFKCYTCYNARGCVYILVDMTLIPKREGGMSLPGVYKASSISLRWLVGLFDFGEASRMQAWL